MMELSNFQAYGVLFLRELRRHPGWVSRKALAAAAGITSGYVARIMGGLIDAGFVATQKGPGGGYQLANRRHRASVLEIVRALPEKGRASGMTGPAAELKGKVTERVNQGLVWLYVDRL